MSHYRPDIDGLRAIAVTLVLLFHAFPGHAPHGFLGVDVFFVISGFLVSEMILRAEQKGTFDFKVFYIRRVRRLFPALLLVLIVTWAVGLLILFPAEYASLSRYVLGSAFFVTNMMLWKDVGYFDASALSKPLLHIWSLSVEEQFYLVWPALLTLVFRYARRKRVLLLSLIALLSFSSQVYLAKIGSAGAFYFLSSRAWEFIIGFFAANLLLVFKRLKANNVLAVLGVVAFLFSLTNFGKTGAVEPWRILLVNLATAVLLISSQSSVFVKILSHPLFVSVGKASYPIYLWHYPVFSFFFILNGTHGTPPQKIVLLGISTILGFITLFLFENPFRYGRFASTHGAYALCTAVFVFGITVGNQGVAISNQEKNVSRETQYRLSECGSQDLSYSCYNLSSSGRKIFLLLGDSHAAQFSHSLFKLKDRYDFDFLQITPGCIGNVLFKNNEKNCTQLESLLLATIKKYTPDAVILSFYWENTAFKSNDNLKKSIDLLLLTGAKKIIILGPTPVWHIDPQTLLRKKIMAANNWIFQSRINQVVYSEEFNKNLLRETHGFFQTVVKNFDNKKVKYIPLSQFLCKDQSCSIFNESPTWSDTHHLSSTGADLVLQRLFQQINIF